MASLAAQLRGACQCGRNQYSVQVPRDSTSSAKIILDSNLNHRVPSATPSSAFMRIPLLWYHSEVFPFFTDESRSTIRRSYTHPDESHTQRSFCGYCGTLLSYWFEEPQSEAEYILLTLGSLLTEDLPSIQKLGLLPEAAEHDDTDSDQSPISRRSTGIPWFDSLISGSRLGTVHTTKGVQQSEDGTSRVEFEITEWTADDSDDEGDEASPRAKSKRKRMGNDKDNTGFLAPHDTA